MLEPKITTIILDPTPENHAAIRCYEKVGFKRVGIYAVSSDYSTLLMRYDIKNIMTQFLKNYLVKTKN